MNCKEYRELIEDALDISLHGDPEKRVRLHLEHCDACRAYFERRRAEHVALFTGINAVYSDLHLPEEFANRLVASVRTRKVGRRVWRHFRLPKWALIAASLVAMVGFAFAAKVVVDEIRGAKVANQDETAVNQDETAVNQPQLSTLDPQLSTSTQQGDTPMNKGRIAAASLTAALMAGTTPMLSGAAAGIPVTDTSKIVMAPGDTLVPAARSIAPTLPSVGTPLFHFDAQTRTGWEFADGDATAITKIPSLSGSRSLTTDTTGGSWTSETWPLSPVLMAEDPTLGGKPCVDFGAIGSKKGLLFNAISDDSTGNVSSNTLEGIGTIFAVINSENGGGSLLGGGFGLNNGGLNKGNMWLRGLSAYLSGAWDLTDPWSPLIRYYNGGVNDVGNVRAAKGIAYHDGVATAPIKVGMNGGWEVISLQPDVMGFTATGIGIGTLNRGTEGSQSGGQRLAELVIYGEILSDADRAAVEAYLEKKWFNRTLRGYGDKAMVDLVRASRNEFIHFQSNGVSAVVNTGAGETLNIGRLMGGRGMHSSFNLKGSGTVTIGDASSYQGTVRLHGGTLAVSKRPIPTALPSGAVLHFDASDASSLHYTVDGDGLKRVSVWDNQSDFSYAGHRLCLAPNHANAPTKLPWILDNAFPGGKPAVDFGPGTTSGAHMLVAHADATNTNVKLSCVSTVIAVVSPHSGATSLVGPFDGATPAATTANSYFNPSAESRTWNQSLFSSAALSSINPTLNGATNNIAFIDGIRHDHTTGYPHPGWQVAAFLSPGSQIGAIGSTANHYYAGGACCLAEIVMYVRPLSEQEIKDASAYLSAKWFGRETPGYAKTAERAQVNDIAVLDVAGAAELNIASGTTVRVGRLMCDSTLRKTGGGTLEVGQAGNSPLGLVVEDGNVVSAAAIEPEDNCSPAKDPAAHFDSSALDSFITYPSGGLDYVWLWYDKNCRNLAYWNSRTQISNEPWINTTDTLNGKPVVDFGATGSYRYLRLAKPLDGVKAAFVVWGSQNGGGTLLGCINVHGFDNSNMKDFLRAANATINNPIFSEDNRSQHVWDGTGAIYTNGVIATKTAKPSGGWDLVEVYPQGAAHVSAFAYGNDGNLTGGQRLAEVILYERTLTEREKVATRNYLMKKWFNAEEQPAPGATADAAVGFGEIQVATTATVDVPTDAVATRLTGDGDLAKTGSGILSIENIDSYTGTVSVAAGGLALTGRAPDTATPTMATDGLILQMDASYGVTTETDVRGRMTVAEWAAKVGDIKAIPDSHGMNPVYAPQGLNGMPTVNMGDATWNCWQYLRFTDLNGDFTRVGGIRSVFWVIGSQEGGGLLLGGGTNANNSTQHYNFHRGGTAGSLASDSLVNGSAQLEVQAANWRVNGKNVQGTSAGLSGGWDVVSMAFQSNAVHATEAEGFAFDGRFNPYVGNYNCAERSSRQRLAEVLIYDRVLTTAEIAQTESYLSRKWNVHVPALSVKNGLSVDLAAGTSLTMGEQTYLAGLSGAGTVAGNLTTGGLVADFATTGFVTVGGTMTVPEGIVVEVRNLPVAAPARRKLLEATDFAGASNLSTATVVGDCPTNRKISLQLKDGAIWCRYSRLGMNISFR